MYAFEFASKLRKLNEHIYVDQRHSKAVDEEWSTAGIYRRAKGRQRQRYRSASLNYAKGGGQRMLEDYYAGHRDLFLCGIALQWVPEYDIFSEDESCQMLAPGWRSVLMRLVKVGEIELSKARKIFSCSSLGEQAYDRLNFEQRQALTKEAQVDGN